MGYRSDDHRYVFLESDNPSEARNIRIIGLALREYLRYPKDSVQIPAWSLSDSPPQGQKVYQSTTTHSGKCCEDCG